MSEEIIKQLLYKGFNTQPSEMVAKMEKEPGSFEEYLTVSPNGSHVYAFPKNDPKSWLMVYCLIGTYGYMPGYCDTEGRNVVLIFPPKVAKELVKKGPNKKPQIKLFKDLQES